MTRILLTGAGGMLAADLRAALATSDVTAVTRAELDVTDADAVRAAVAGHDVVINAAAYTRVDDAEADEDAAFLVNAVGPKALAGASRDAGARFVQISTDYVFDGAASEPYREDADRAPLSAYGRTKAAGEVFTLEEHAAGSAIVRTAWLYGANGPSFPATMLRLAAERDTLDVVEDQRGQPTWTADLAAQVAALVDAGVPAGVYHGTNAGETTWFGFARAVFAAAGLDERRVRPTDSAAFARPAPRPASSVLGHDGWAAAGLAPMRPWRDALDAAFAAGVFGERRGA